MSSRSVEGQPALGALGVLRMPRTVIFGSGQRSAVGAAVAELGRSALICTDARLAATPELASMVEAITSAGVLVTVYGETEPELPVASVARCAAELIHTEIDVVVGFGGGSCIDMAKVIALLVTHGGRLSDYYGELQVPGPVLPIVAVPTTGGTGSEATPVAVVSDPDQALKVGISSPHLIPEVAICDPELTLTCPAGLTAATGADALTHLIESFTAIRRPPTSTLSHERVFVGKSTFSDSIALQGIQLMGRSLLTVHRSPSDLRAREEVMMASLAGGIAFGVGGVAAAHALQYPLGAMTHTSHGEGVGALLPYVMRYNLPSRVPQFAAIARALLGADAPSNEAAAARLAITAVDGLVDGLGLPSSLAEMGLKENQIDEMAELGSRAKRLTDNNPRPLTVAALRDITRAAFVGDRTFDDQTARSR